MLLVGAPVATASAEHEPLARVIASIDAGAFREADALIARALQDQSLPSPLRGAFEFERERMHRLRLDFSLTEEDARARIRKQIPDLKDTEFTAWDAQGLLESMSFDGERRYFNRAPSNLFRLSAVARERRSKPVAFNDGPLEREHPHHREIIDAQRASGRTSVAPRRVRVTHSITVNADVVPAGETLRVWIPYPRSRAGQHEDIRLLSSVPAKATTAPQATLQRTVYLEDRAQAGRPTRFEITYELTSYAQRWQIDPEKVTATPATADTRQHLGERPPHILFTPALREFSRRIVGDERNPYRIAMKLFDAVDRIPWAGAREYSTISNISDYALHAGHADCGQQTLLLMTLLRLNGIPARWQSGWVFSDGAYNNMHDWGWLYLAPYGWVPMDVTFGKLESNDAAIAGFYFGSLDAYRLAFNDDYGQPLSPPKQHFRSETVDSQRGEVEWRGGNLYFDTWDYNFDARVIPVAEQ